MGFRFRKSKSFGPFRVNFSKSGIGYSVGGKGFRITKTAKGTIRQTASIPGTGISYVKETRENARTHTSAVVPQYTKKQQKNLKTNLIIIRVTLILLAIIAAATVWAIYYETTVQTGYTSEQLLLLDSHPKIYDTVQAAEKFYDQFDESRIKVADLSWISQRQRGLKSYADDKVIMYLVEDGTYINGAIFNLKESDFGRSLDVSSVFDVIGTYIPADLCKVYQTDATYTFSTDEETQYVYCGRLYGEGAPAGYSYYISITATNFQKDGFWRVEVSPEAYGGRSLDWIEKFSSPWDFDISQYVK